MRLKKELYEKEQNEIIGKIISILDLDKNNSILLYDLENDKDKTSKLMKLLPDARTYFSISHINALAEPEKAKRPWLSLIRQLTKSKYDMLSCDFRIKKIEKKCIRTKKYLFIKK